MIKPLEIANRRPFFSVLVAAALAAFQVGCLQTRTAVRETEERQVLQKTVRNLQQTNADVSSRFQDVDEDIRKLNGRVETTDHKLAQLSARADKADQAAEQRIKEMSEKLTIYQEALTKLDQQVAELTQSLRQTQEDLKRAPPPVAAAAASGAAGRGAGAASGPYAAAEDYFKKQSWKEAILEYEKYRKGFPKGGKFADSTYKIGVCFQELGMVEEAKAFFEEVVAKFPKSKEADKAAYRLKTLLKK